MELKLISNARKRIRNISLNRTFYGIETVTFSMRINEGHVLIVPFMELKLSNVNGQWSLFMS